MKKIQLFLLTFSFALGVQAQDFLFSQHSALPLNRNPALCGLFHGNFRATAGFRNQWSTVTVPYQTTVLGVETIYQISDTRNLVSFGTQLAYDVAGDSRLSRTHILPTVSFHKSLDYDQISYLILGFQGGLVLSQFDPTKLRYGSQFDINTGTILPTSNVVFDHTSKSYYTGSAGLVFTSELSDGARYYWGIAGYNLLRSKVNFYDDNNIILKPRFSINSGIELEVGPDAQEDLILSADASVQGGNRQLLLSALFGHYWKNNLNDLNDRLYAYIGLNYRWNDALIPTIKIKGNKLGAAISYDFNISSLKSASQSLGGCELTLSYIENINALKSRKQRERGPDCEWYIKHSKRNK